MPKKYRNGITKQEANDLFISDLSVTEEGLRKRVNLMPWLICCIMQE